MSCKKPREAQLLNIQEQSTERKARSPKWKTRSSIRKERSSAKSSIRKERSSAGKMMRLEVKEMSTQTKGTPEEEKLQEEVVGKAADKERKEPENKEDAAVVHAKPKRRLTVKYLALSGTFPHLEEGEGLELGKPSLKEIIANHGGIVDNKVQGRTNILVIGNRPGKVKVRDGTKQAVQIVHIYTLEQYLGGTMTFKELIETPPPKITESLAGYPQKLPPETQATKPSGGMQLNLPHAVPTDSITDSIASAESDSSVRLISPPWQHGIETIPATAKEQKRSVVFQ